MQENKLERLEATLVHDYDPPSNSQGKGNGGNGAMVQLFLERFEI